MGFQLWLADVLRDAGLTVHEVSGWRTRSAGEDKDASTFAPRGLIIHETRGSASSTDAGEIGVLINGRVGLSGPIAQLYVGRDGDWHVVAAGLCHHVKTGWGGPFSGLGNSRLLGIEPAHSADEDWARKPVQYASYVRGVAAILRHTGWPAPVGHKEHQPGDKPDPEFSMATFRADVAAVLAGEDDDMTPQELLDTKLGSPALGDRTVGDWLKGGESARREAAAAKTVAQAAADKVDAVADKVDELLARPPAGAVTVDDAQLARVLEPVLRKIIGGVDGATPAE